MKELTINTPGGYIFHTSDNYKSYEYIDESNIDANSLFWDEIFSESNISKTLEYVKLQYQYSKNVPLKIQVILTDTIKFRENLNAALRFKFKENITKIAFWSCLETLEMFCKIYTYCYSTPFELSIVNGFIHNIESSEILSEYCLSKNHNPYLEFVEKTLIPIIAEKTPKVIWVTGRPTIATFALARIIKIKFPDIYIVLCDHKTDYYSLYKIRNLLLNNDILFCFFDFILLHDSLDNRERLIDSIYQNRGWEKIPGLMFRDESEIKMNQIFQMQISKDDIDHNNLELNLFPQNFCYWNRCSFCGINQKYTTTLNNWDIHQAITLLKRRSMYDRKYMWLVDEAIPPSVLKKLLFEFKKNHLHFIWHFRTRIEKELLDADLIQLVVDSGVKSIILGFESASNRILELMNKTRLNDYLIIAEKIVEKYTSRGIYIHFPVLIGFPTETNEEREYTLKFIEYLMQKYTLFSFNINILELDVCSDLYKNWAVYNIKRLEFPCLPKYFLGNSISWNCNTTLLNAIRSKQMKKQFPWFPNNSYISINSFYYAWEHSKGVLYENNKKIVPKEKIIYINDIQQYMISSNVILFQMPSNEYGLYNYNNHNSILGGDIICLVYQILSDSLDIKSINKKFNLSPKIIIDFLNDLLELDFIIKK